MYEHIIILVLLPDIFLTDIFSEPIKVIERLSGKTYKGNEEPFRVILDHLRAATFLIGDGVYPANKDQNYFVRRFVRRAIRFAHKLGIQNNYCGEVARAYIDYYKDDYTNLSKNTDKILEELEKEENKFRKTLEKGLRELKSEINNIMTIGKPSMSGDQGKIAFYFFETFGFPLDLFFRGVENVWDFI